MTALPPSELDMLGLDRFQAYDDRQAALAAIRAQLTPPKGLPLLYGRLRADTDTAWEHFRHLRKTGARSFQGPQALALEHAARDAAQAHLEWTGRGLREFFISQAEIMMGWVQRLRWNEPNSDWRPCDWVAAARELDASALLLGLVIEQAPTPSWKAWLQAFDLSSDWRTHWQGWEEGFRRAPAPALRWLDALLLAPQLPNASVLQSEAIGEMAATRGRLWQQIYQAEQCQRPTVLLRDLDHRLGAAGAVRDLRAIDWSAFFRDDANGACEADVARERLHRFLATCPTDAADWLCSKLPVAPSAWEELGPSPSAPRLLGALTALGYRGKADMPTVRAWLRVWARQPGQAAASQALGDDLFRQHGVTFQPPPEKRPRHRKTSASPQTPSAKTTADAPPLEAIPRFHRR